MDELLRDLDGEIAAKLDEVRAEQAGATLRPPSDPAGVPRPRRDSYSAIRRPASGQFQAQRVPVVPTPRDEDWNRFVSNVEVADARRVGTPTVRPGSR